MEVVVLSCLLLILGIVGYGHIGAQLSVLGCPACPLPRHRQHYAPHPSLEKPLQELDFLTLHVPGSEDTFKTGSPGSIVCSRTQNSPSIVMRKRADSISTPSNASTLRS
jgi:hypothetical protein